MQNAALCLLLLAPAEKPIDPAVAAAWGWSATPAVVVPAGPRLTADGLPADPAPPGHEWQRWPGENWKLVKVGKGVDRPAVATFRNGPVRHEGHRCPECNYESPPRRGTWVVRDTFPDGHTHQCPRCSTVWFH